MLRRCCFALLLGATMLGGAYATTPLLTERPNQISPTACKAWAAEQDDDAIEMWGIQQDGRSLPSVALDRLTRHCMGEPTPEIVGFNSSVGFNELYCRKYPTTKICIEHRRQR